MRRSLALSSALTIPALLLAACGEDGTSSGVAAPDAAIEAVDASTNNGEADAAEPATRDAGAVVTLGGTVIGLGATTGDAGLGGSGSGGLVLTNGADKIEIFANGPFEFPTSLASGTAFDVAIATQPSNPIQTCTVGGGKGTAGANDITSVTVNCDPTTFTIGGAVSGVTTAVTLRLNDAIDVDATSASGTYAFGTALPSGAAYSVAVKTMPVDQKCTLTNATGIVTNAVITNVDVTCVDDPVILSVDVSGFAGKTPLTLNNGADTLTIGGNGVFSFATKVDLDQTYAISASSQPTLPYQDCTVGSVAIPAAGTITKATTVPVSCKTKTFNVTGTVSGKRAGTTLGVTSGPGQSTPVTNNGAFTIGSVESGAVVDVGAQPGTQKCFVDGGAVTIGNSDVSVNVTCYDEVAFAGVGNPAVTDFEVPLKLTTTNFDYARAKAQGDDLRFYATPGGTAISYYIESWNAAGDSVVWVKVPAIAAASTTKLLMFAGNAAATAGSSGTGTFLFFDDFSGTAIDTNKWEVRGAPQSVVASGGKLTFTGNSNWEYARSKTTFTSGVIEADYATGGVSGALVIGKAGSDDRYTFRESGGATGTTFDTDVAGGNSFFDATYPGTPRTENSQNRREKISVAINGSNQIAISEYCNVTTSNCAGAKALTSTTASAFIVGFSSYGPAYPVIMDRVFVHKLAAGTFTATLL